MTKIRPGERGKRIQPFLLQGSNKLCHLIFFLVTRQASVISEAILDVVVEPPLLPERGVVCSSEGVHLFFALLLAFSPTHPMVLLSQRSHCEHFRSEADLFAVKALPDRPTTTLFSERPLNSTGFSTQNSLTRLSQQLPCLRMRGCYRTSPSSRSGSIRWLACPSSR